MRSFQVGAVIACLVSFLAGLGLAALPAWGQAAPATPVVDPACPPCPPCLSPEAQKAVDDAMKALDAAKK